MLGKEMGATAVCMNVLRIAKYPLVGLVGGHRGS